MQDDAARPTGATAWPPPPPATPGPPGERLNPWISIWTMPRATMRQILDTDPRRLVIPLALIAGVVGALGAVPALPSLTDRFSAGPGVMALALALVLVPLCSLLMLYVVGWLLSVTGRWLDGTGDSVGMRAALAWSNVPAIWGGLLLIPHFVTLGARPADPADLLHNPGALFLEGILGLLKLVLAVWQLVVLLKCVGEAHGFSAWRALGAGILAFLIVCAVLSVPFVALAMLIAGLR